MARIVYNNDKYLAAVNRAGYIKDVKKFERKLRIWNVYYRATQVLAFIAATFLIIFMSALDDPGNEKLVFSCIALSTLGLAISILMLKVPRPKLPFGIKIHNGRYVIAGFTHPGEDVVEVNTDYVYEDGRKCRVLPCNLKPRRRCYY